MSGDASFKDPFLVAQEKGLDIVLPECNQLQIDLDNDFDAGYMEDQIEILKSHGLELHVEKTTTSKGGNKHCYINAGRELTHIERIALQACLGSDRHRELLSLIAVITDSPYPATVFFEVPQKALPAQSTDDEYWDEEDLFKESFPMTEEEIEALSL